MVECESLTTISVAPPASAPSIAALTSASSSFRPAAASAPWPTHCSQSTTPAVPSISLDRKTFMSVLSYLGSLLDAVGVVVGAHHAVGRPWPGRSAGVLAGWGQAQYLQVR